MKKEYESKKKTLSHLYAVKGKAEKRGDFKSHNKLTSNIGSFKRKHKVYE